MNYRKVYGGTPQGNESRCDTCLYSRIVKGYAQSEQIVMCDRIYDLPMRIPFKVAECSDYLDRRLPSFDELEKIALDITVERGRKVSGFRIVSGRTHETDVDNE